MINVAINGFGRIGRSFFRALVAKGGDIRVVAINDLGSITQLAHLLKYDTAFGRFTSRVEAKEGVLVVDGQEIAVYQEREPAKLPWKELNIDVVLESTGVFTDGKKAQVHLNAGAKKVLISAPGTNVDLTLVLGVNHGQYLRDKHHIISNASCTTNCLAPVAKVLQDNFGIESGFMTTVHAYTQDRKLQDAPHADLRRARSAAQNEEVNALFKTAAESADLKGILTYTEDQIVSSDIIQDSASSIFDAGLTKVIRGKLLKVVSWYDNEWGFSNRLVDAIILIA